MIHTEFHLDTSAIARSILMLEAAAITAAAERLNDTIQQAVQLLINHPGKVIVTGLGKSGHIGAKIAATLSSTGTPAVFMHASEAFHGDLGIYTSGDPTIMLSKSGTTEELLKLAPIVRGFGSPLIGILGNVQSPLAGQMDVVLDASVQREADPNNLAPTASTTVALALGDALACTLVHARGFSAEAYARFHPGGQLGRNLNLTVADAAQMGNKVAWISPTLPLKEVVIAMTRFPLGAACVIDEDSHLLGLITDGDLRRALLHHDDIRTLKAEDIMTRNPITVISTQSLKDAVELMENRPNQISVLPVRDETRQTCIGLLRIHDIYRSGIGNVS